MVSPNCTRSSVFAVFALLAVVLSSCSSHTVPVRKDFVKEEISIELFTDPAIDPLITEQLHRQFADFILRHNAEEHLFKVRMDAEETDISFNVLGVRLVSPGQQAGGLLLTGLGIALPFIMVSAGSDYYFAFWYAPQAHSFVEVRFDPQMIDHPKTVFNHVIASPGFLRSPQNQITMQGRYFNSYLRRMMNQLEKSMKDARRKSGAG